MLIVWDCGYEETKGPFGYIWKLKHFNKIIFKWVNSAEISFLIKSWLESACTVYEQYMHSAEQYPMSLVETCAQEKKKKKKKLETRDAFSYPKQA